jgi:hypothetical protein
VKSIKVFFFIYSFIHLASCTQPITNSLLVDQKSECDGEFSSCPSLSQEDPGGVEIKAESSLITKNMETGDTVEITGSCKDLGRKDNRILVQVFAGEDEATPPYFSNEEGNNCLNTTSATQTGLTSASGRCFWITKGDGRIENAGLPEETSFPQCHNGRFGFSVRLGKVLLNPNPGQPNLKYLVRLKLRTLDSALISDSVWDKVVVERNLSTPTITSAVPSAAAHKCTIKADPARFNFGISYELTRTFTDILQTNAGAIANIFLVPKDTSVTTPGLSVFEWDDSSGMVDGVTYNYTLTSTENNFVYAPAAPTSSSVVASCQLDRLAIQQNAAPGLTQCYLSLRSDLTLNSNTNVTYEWGYMTTSSNWIGAQYDTNAGYSVAAACAGFGVCTQGGLAGGTTHFFSVRTRNTVTGEIGRWSPVFPCTTL